MSLLHNLIVLIVYLNFYCNDQVVGELTSMYHHVHYAGLGSSIALRFLQERPKLLVTYPLQSASE